MLISSPLTIKVNFPSSGSWI